jgi:hypothetical protein
MIVWAILVAFCAGINLFVFIALRGRWGRLVPVLALASVLGTIGGDALGERVGLNILRIGSFEFLAGSLAAQVAMLVTLLLTALAPSDPGSGDEG